MFTLAREALAAIYLHAEETYPEECCGLVLSDAEIRRCRNVLGEARDTRVGASARSARDGYTLSFEDALFLQRSFETLRPTRVIYHSHPDAGAHFSDEDRERALLAGEPIHPVSYLVVEVRLGRAKGARLYAYSGGDFQCVASFDEAGRGA